MSYKFIFHNIVTEKCGGLVPKTGQELLYVFQHDCILK